MTENFLFESFTFPIHIIISTNAIDHTYALAKEEKKIKISTSPFHSHRLKIVRNPHHLKPGLLQIEKQTFKNGIVLIIQESVSSFYPCLPRTHPNTPS